MHYELIIVGGGVWGCSAALRACERGVKSVLLIEANAGVAQESSAKAGGVVTNLLWHDEDVDWVDRSRAIYDRALRSAGDRSIIQDYGMLTLYRDHHASLVKDRTDMLQRRGAAFEIWENEQIVRAFPDLDRLEASLRAVWTPNDKHVNPTAYSEAVLAMARAQGLAVRLGQRVTAMEVGASRVVVTVGGEEVTGERVLVTAGTWTKKLVGTVGIGIPLRPYRVQLSSLDFPDGYHLPMVWELETDVYLVPDGPHNILAGDGTRLSEFDPDDYDTTGDDQFLSDIADGVTQLTSLADKAGLRSSWAGLCGGTPDRRPLLGPVADRLFVACGDQGIGVMRGPALGELAADVALGEAEEPHLSPLRQAPWEFPIRAGFTLEA